MLPILLQSVGRTALGFFILVLLCGCDNRDRQNFATRQSGVGVLTTQDIVEEFQTLMADRDYDALFARRERLEQLASSDDPRVADTAYAALMTVDGHIDLAWKLAWGTSEGVTQLLAAMPLLVDEHLRIALAERALPLLDDDSLSLLSGWPDEQRLATRKAVIAAVGSVAELEQEIRAALEAARDDPALRDAATAALKLPVTDQSLDQPRQAIRRYTMSELEPVLNWPAGSRSFAHGRRAYHEVGCHRCHVQSEHDTLVGPHLTGAEYRPSRRELAEAIIAPDKQIAENYRQYLLVVDGKPITGLVTEQTENYLVVIADPMHDCTPKRVERGQLDEDPTPLTTSAMPEGMCDVLSQEELLDLLAYVEAKGDRRHASFRRQESP